MLSTRSIVSSRRCCRLSPSMASNILLLSATVTLLCGLSRSSAEVVQSASPTAEEVDIDLLNGIVKGYSQYIQFVAAPVPTKDRDCTAQAVMRVDVGGPFSRFRLTLDYDRPRLWTLDVSDSADADGYGSPGVDGVESSMTEIQLFNSQLRIYGNSLPGHRDASVDGGHLLKVADGVVDRKHNRLVLDVAAERVEWRGHANGAERKQSIESKFVFGRPTPTIPPAQTSGVDEEDHVTSAEGGNETAGIVYVALNRVVAGNFRSGSGLCRVLVSLFSDDADRCSQAQNQCHADAICYNVTKSYRCKCRPGFHGNGRNCLDVNECEKENGRCVHLCHNSHGGYRCTCFDGFRLDTDSGAQNCLDINECAVNNGGCEHECVNSIGSFECRCRPGYFMAANGKNCISGSNWCREQFGCAHHCHSTALGIKCVCRRGYRLLTNGKDCVHVRSQDASATTAATDRIIGTNIDRPTCTGSAVCTAHCTVRRACHRFRNSTSSVHQRQRNRNRRQRKNSKPPRNQRYWETLRHSVHIRSY